jgi:hypothetical protein
MRDETKLSQGKEEYRGPDIVDVGDVIAATTGHSEPVKDLESDPVTWYNAAKFNSEGLQEVDLGDD